MTVGDAEEVSAVVNAPVISLAVSVAMSVFVPYCVIVLDRV
jgi:hypothetical protein